jgi:hypothetical protein
MLSDIVHPHRIREVDMSFTDVATTTCLAFVVELVDSFTSYHIPFTSLEVY